MIKVLHVFTDMGIGGTEKVIYQISDYLLSDHNFEVSIVSTNGPMEQKFIQRGINNYRIKNFKKKYSIFSNIKELYKVIKAVNPDIIHTHSLYSLMLVYFIKRIFSSKLNFKIIHTGHGGPKRNYDQLASKLIKMADKYICISEYSYKKLLKSTTANNIELIRNGVDQPKQNEEAKIQQTKGKLKMGFIGRLTEQKGVIYIIKALETILKDKDLNISLKIVGDGDLVSELKEYVHLKRLSSNVEFVGYKENPWVHVNDCHMILMPSLWENGGLVAMEAIVRGHTVIVSSIQGLKDTVIHGVNGYHVEPGNTESLAKIILDLYETETFISINNKEKNQYLFINSTGPKMKKLYYNTLGKDKDHDKSSA
ncbi:glycosyltransferase [Niallia taxi]|uniref:glycosyltransferase n=1 Tax=Niallia taxi TaxID=2499688 RepID=UPI002E1A6280|nr:glycosyltransferase [Niallia taxi]MED4039106.1 glycosyltransferase [Niallia taxi]